MTLAPLDINPKTERGLDSLFQNPAIITPKKGTVQPEGAFEDTAFNQWFDIVKF
jgi:hypothetical protein